MNDENFDKIFGDKLSAGKDFRYTEAKWGKMEGKIAAFEAEQRLRRLLMWLCVPLLALIGFSIWEGRALHTAQNDLARLNEEVKTLRTENRVGEDPSVFLPNLTPQNSHTVIKSDTVYRHVVIKRYDTVFQTVVQRVLSDITPLQQEVLLATKQGKTETTVSENVVKQSVIADNMPKKVEAALPQTRVISENKDGKLSETAVLTEKTSIKDSPNTVATDSLKTVVETAPLPTDSGSAISIEPEKQPKSVIKAPKSLFDKLIQKVEKQEEKLLPIIKPFKKLGFEIGVSGGLAMIDGQNIVRQDGFTAGLRAGVLLGKRWKIVGEAQFLALNYDVDKISSNLDIPTVAPPSPNDIFDIVRLEQPYIQYSVGLQYVLLQKTLKPYVGLSLLGQSKLDENFEYHFKNQVTRQDVLVKTRRKAHNFDAPFLRLQLGTEYPIFRKLKGQLEGSYDVKLNHAPQFQPIFQLKGGILYRF